MRHSTLLAQRLATLLLASLLFAACQVEGGVPEIPTSEQITAQPQATDAAQAAAVNARRETWTIGIAEQLGDLSPYQPSATEQRRSALAVELLFPSPIVSYDRSYTTTGVLEQVPTIENGGAVVRPADVFLDSSGVITTTATQIITQVNQIVVTYHWNPDLQWSDGTALTAADSVFAYERSRASPASDEVRGKLGQTASYTAVDEHTTQAVLLPDVTGPTYFLNYWTPLPKHLLENATPEQSEAFAQQPLGYGPYAIQQREAGAIRMARNQHYFGTPPANPQLDILFAQNVNQLRANVANGNLDVIYSERVLAEEIAALDDDAKAGIDTVQYAPTPVWEHIDYNLDLPELQEIRVRRAIALGTNRGQMIKDLLGGHSSVLDSWVLPFQPEAAPADQITRYDYNPDQARALLDEADYKDADGDGIRASPDGLTLTLQLLTSADSPLRDQIAQRFSQDMRAIGIDVEVTTTESNELFAPEGPLYQRQFELALYGWKAEPNAGGLTLWNCNSVPSPENNFTGENFAGWCFRDADMAIRKGATTLDPGERNALYLRQQQLWTQELPALPLFQRIGALAIAQGVSGPQLDTFAPITWNVAQWRRE